MRLFKVCKSCREELDAKGNCQSCQARQDTFDVTFNEGQQEILTLISSNKEEAPSLPLHLLATIED